MAQSAIIVEGPFDDAALAAHLALSARRYGPDSASAHREHVGWKLRDPPAGVGLHYGLVRDGGNIGRFVLQRRDLRMGTRVFHAAHPIDLLVDDEKVGATDALKLVGKLPREKGFDLAYHTCNANAAPLYAQISRFFPNYLKRFELLPFGLPLRARRPIKGMAGLDLPGLDLLTAPWRGLLSFLKPSRDIEMSDEPPGAVELAALMDRFAGAVGLHSVRDLAVLNWRFGTGPLFNGKITWLRRDKALVGYCATTVTAFAGARVLALMDAVADPALADAVMPAIRRRALTEALDAKADLVFTMINPASAMARRLTGFPFVKLPVGLMKHPTPMFVVDIDRSLANVAARDDGYFMLTDIDYF